MEIVLAGYLIMQAAVFAVVGIEYWKDCVRTRKPGSKPMRQSKPRGGPVPSPS